MKILLVLSLLTFNPSVSMENEKISMLRAEILKINSEQSALVDKNRIEILQIEKDALEKRFNAEQEKNEIYQEIIA